MCRKTLPRAFTLVELLIVVAIIGILVGLIVPVIAMVRGGASATSSQANLRQWGMGTTMFVDQKKGRLPWEGRKDANDMEANLAEPTFWANAVPPFIGQPTYSEIIQQALATGTTVPVAPHKSSVFIDPSASSESSAPWQFGPALPGGRRKAFFFCYVPNSQLNNTFLADSGQASNLPEYAMPFNVIGDPGSTIVMLEMRTTKSELPPSDPHHDLDLNRHRIDWKRFAARHRAGGHILFADNHVAREDNRSLINNAAGTTVSGPGADWNKPGFVWDPLGPATDG